MEKIPRSLYDSFMVQNTEVAIDFRELFTESDCWVLAREISENLELDLGMISPQNPELWTHMGIIMENLFVDISGIYSSSEIIFLHQSDFTENYGVYKISYREWDHLTQELEKKASQDEIEQGLNLVRDFLKSKDLYELT